MRLNNSEQALKAKSDTLEMRMSGSTNNRDMRVRDFHRTLKEALRLNW
jgi:hypothetical protein